MCYARIQGTAQLINHFKNSNVIQQKDKKLRPLIEDYSNLVQMVERQKSESNQESDIWEHKFSMHLINPINPQFILYHVH